MCKLLNPIITNSYDFNNLPDSNEDDIILCDATRTRISELNTGEQQILKNVIKHYCLELKIRYKQGLNEILAPFILIMQQGISINEAYECFKEFIAKCLPNIFTDAVYTN